MIFYDSDAQKMKAQIYAVFLLVARLAITTKEGIIIINLLTVFHGLFTKILYLHIFYFPTVFSNLYIPGGRGVLEPVFGRDVPSRSQNVEPY